MLLYFSFLLSFNLKKNTADFTMDFGPIVSEIILPMAQGQCVMIWGLVEEKNNDGEENSRRKITGYFAHMNTI